MRFDFSSSLSQRFSSRSKSSFLKRAVAWLGHGLDKQTLTVQDTAMAGRKRDGTDTAAHRFGGDWTETKLEILSRYLEGYTTALKNQRFKTAYIDAFAGTGYRSLPAGENEHLLLFPDLAEPAPQALLDGSARVALKTEPQFHSYIFIERSRDRSQALAQLKDEFPERDIQIKVADANRAIQDLCRKNWSSRRAVLFLDPYGMQVEWATLEAVAATKAIDLWLLFPLGIGVNRLLTRSGDIPASWRQRLDILLGTDDWYENLYTIEKSPSLFEDETTHLIKASTESIGRYFISRLTSIFSGVAPEPRILLNSARCPLYLFCFAVGNPKGAEIALRIANHLLKEIP